MIGISIFGETTAVVDGRVLGARDLGGGKPRRLLEFLSLQAGRAVPKAELIAALWDGAPPHGALATLESYACLLRRQIQPGVPPRWSVIRTVPGGYALDADQADVDLARFRRLIAGADEAGASPTAAPLLREALALSEQGLLLSEPSAAWAAAARASTKRRIVAACAQSARLALAEGDHDAAISIAQRAVLLEPLAESAGRALIEGLWRAGRRGEALQEYEALRRALLDALGADPSAETRALHLAVLQDGSLPRSGGGGAGGPAEPLRAAAQALADLLAGGSNPRAWDLAARLVAELTHA